MWIQELACYPNLEVIQFYLDDNRNFSLFFNRVSDDINVYHRSHCNTLEQYRRANVQSLD